MPFPRPLVAALATAGLLVAPGAAHAADVTIANKAFGPADATIAVGDSVTWHWGDGPHSVHVVQGPAQFNSGIRTAGATFTQAFTAPGVYSYQCDVHPSMHGQVVVTGAAAALPASASAAAPRLASVRVSRLAVVEVTASAPATLQARILRGARTLKRATAAVVTGANRIALPVRALALGRYRVEIVAVDAAGHRSAPVVRALVVTRAARTRRPLLGARAVPASPAAPGPATPADDHARGGARHA